MLELEDYYDLLNALDGGFGIELNSEDSEDHIQAFQRLCKLMWVKNATESDLFEQQFAIFLSEEPISDVHQTPNGSTDDLEPYQDAEPLKDKTTTEKETPQEDTDPISDQPIEIPAPQIQATEPQQVYRPMRHQFLISQKYFPITRREMQQSWRYLHRSERTGLSNQMDVATTVRNFARKGYLEKPSFHYKYENQIRLHILVDVGGSMIAFDGLCKELVETAREGGKVQEVTDFYFRNIPKNRIYTDAARTEWVPMDKFFQSLDPMRSSVLIISDAGAARGSRNLQRLFFTEGFLEELHHKTLRIAWLNPLPRKRWKANGAEKVAQWVSMFTIDREGLDQAIDVLKGKIID